VREEGDAALLRLTERFDRFDPAAAGLRISAEEIEAATRDCPEDLLSALDLAAERIADYHRRQLPEDASWVDSTGTTLGWRWTPIDAAGLYVPGGLAAYPSSVLMNAVPAKVAGVARLVMVVPTPDGHVNPLVLAAAQRSGVDEIYRVGGAQAVAALAYGTATIAPVDKIVGPGNAYVAAAKRQVFGRVGIDSIAGPSEILVVADAANDPEIIAMDLLSQAEHDRAAQSILMTDDDGFAEAVAAAADRWISESPRREITGAAWADHGVLIVVDRLAGALPLIDRIAPEHLELAIDEPQDFARRVRHAGAIFMGRHTPEAVGDYVAGPDHVLPTSGGARFASGLSVLDFLKRTSLTACSERGLAAIGPAAQALAEAEGLWAHEQSIALRLARMTSLPKSDPAR
jgi:histidinol dehydrogenase